MEVDHPPSEIAPSNSTAANNVNNNGGTSKDVNHSGAFVLPYNPDLVEPNRVPSSGQRIKLQVEVNSDYKFLTICDPASTISLLFAPYFLAREYKVSSPHLLPLSMLALLLFCIKLVILITSLSIAYAFFLDYNT